MTLLSQKLLYKKYLTGIKKVENIDFYNHTNEENNFILSKNVQ